MGLFDTMCVESGLIIDREQRLIPIIETTKDTWVPIALPIAGTNDRGGTMDVPRKLDANMKRIAAFGKLLAYNDELVDADDVDLGGVLDEIRADGGGATYEGKRVSFALVHGAIFDGIVGAVKKSNATAWRRWAQLGLGVAELPLPNRAKPTRGKRAKPAPIDPTTKRLCEAILEDPDDAAARKVYVDHLLEQGDPRGKLLALVPALGKMSFDSLAAHGLPATRVVYEGVKSLADFKPALVELVRFLAWGTKLGPASSEGQFFGYGPDDPKHDPYADLQGWAQPYTERARLKYAGMPELLAACDRNEHAFRERQS